MKRTNTWEYRKLTPSGDERNIRKRVYQEKQNQLETKVYSMNHEKGINTCAVPLSKILRTILEVDLRKT